MVGHGKQPALGLVVFGQGNWYLHGNLLIHRQTMSRGACAAECCLWREL